MSLQDDFRAFLHDIEPKKSTVDEIASAHKTLRAYLEGHECYSQRCIATYLSGSYAKHTAIRPVKDEDHRDVDIVVETDYSTSENSADSIIELRDVLYDSDRYKSARLQTHSVGIALSKLDIDVVPLASEEEKRFIGNLDDASWRETNPKGHIEWSSQTNAGHDGLYVPVVKMMKWWRREHCPKMRRWPKGITLEKIIADCFPEGSSAYEELMIGLFENISDSLSDELETGEVPVIADPALPTNNLAASYTFEDFRSFIGGLEEALRVLQEEGSNNDSWRKILGSRFPSGSSSASNRALAKPVYSIEQALCVPHRKRSPWPFTKRRPGVVVVVADVTLQDGHVETISSNGRVIPKGCQIDYRIIRSKGLQSLTAKWLVVNTGEEAYAAGCPRGEFENSNLAGGGRRESTAYAGRHYVQCLLIKGGRCVARSKEFFIIVQ